MIIRKAKVGVRDFQGWDYIFTEVVYQGRGYMLDWIENSIYSLVFA
jgi:hypothetical protein